MENYFAMNLCRREIDAFSNLALAHLGDGVFSLLCRARLCARGEHTAQELHRHSIAQVNAPAQAAFAEKILPLLTQEEQVYYRRGKNAHTHAAPKAASPKEYAMATGLETLFGALYLAGQTQRLNELFALGLGEGE